MTIPSSRPSLPSLSPFPCFCAVNNHGASLLQAGHYKQAIDVLAVGLKQVRDQMTTTKKATETGNVMPGSPTSSTSCCSICLASYDGTSSSYPPTTDNNKSSLSLAQRLSTEECLLTTTTTTTTTTPTRTNDTIMMSVATHKVGSQDDQSFSEEDHEQKHFLFRFPIFVPNNRHLSQGTISFMMIFNMALSYDLMSESSLEGHDEKTIIMGQRAKDTSLKLYQLAYKVQDGEGNSEIPLLYLCGLMNNMARLYICTTNDQEMATWCLAYLLSILMFLTTEKQRFAFMDARNTPHLETYFLSKFFHSTSAIILKDPAPAGAA